jgi:CheY-like chemotaxis protein
MQIESRLGQGTTVSMYLPRSGQVERRAVPRGTASGPMDRLPRGEEQILVVEDEHAIRAVLVHLLRSLGYRVLEAEDGPGALSQLNAGEQIDLLLTDVVLPNGLSGGALAADAKTLRPEIKVLFSSGYTRNVLIRDRRLEEGVHLLTKPFRLGDLAMTVRRVLDLG